jgi:hypothetical protein
LLQRSGRLLADCFLGGSSLAIGFDLGVPNLLQLAQVF